MIMRFRPANIRLINRRSILPRLLLALSSKDERRNDNNKNNPTDVRRLTGHSISVKIRDPFCVSTLLVHAGAAKQVGWFEPAIKYAEDHDFLLRLSLITPFCYVNQQLCLIDQSTSPEGSKCRPWD
jgi:hypothetical protein